MKRTTKSLIALLVLVAMCVSFCVPTFATEGEPHAHAETTCPEKHTLDNCESVIVTVVAPKCGERGYTIYKCVECETPFLDSWTDGEYTEHDYKEIERTEATCVDDGVIIYECQRDGCGHVKKETISAVGAHAWGEWIYNVENYECSDEGVERTRECAKCDASETEKISATEHDWKITITAPDCVTPGNAHYECNNCTASKDVVVKPLTTDEAHKWEYTVTKEPTCSSTGIGENAKCTVCGKTQYTVVIPQLENAHKWVDVDEVPATCDKAGTAAGVMCENCGTVKSGMDEIAALGHDEVELKDRYVAPSCAEENGAGQRVYVCNTCGEERIEVIPKLLHSYEKEGEEAYTYSQAPTCTKYGYRFKGCSACGYTTQLEQVSPLSHKIVVDLEKSYAPTCYEVGKTYYKCENGCTAETDGAEVYVPAEPDIVPATNHVGTLKTIPVGATCSIYAYTYEKCTACGYEGEPSYDEESGYDDKVHSLKIVASTPATCTEKGKDLYYCEFCSHKETEIKPALGHDWVVVEGSEEPASCDAPKTWMVKCSRKDKCGVEDEERTEGISSGHKFVPGEIVAPECGKGGYTPYTCSECGAYIEGDKTEPLEHVWDYEYVPATCQNTLAYYKGTCELCGETDIMYPDEGSESYEKYDIDNMEFDHTLSKYHLNGIPQLDENKKPVIYREGTCSVLGLYSYVCSDCGLVYYVEVEGTGAGCEEYSKVYGVEDTIPASAPDCTNDGAEEAYICKCCGEKFGGAIIEKLGHDWKAADCVTAKTCNRCGEVDGEPVGHDWKAADCENAKTCNVCGETEGVALGHTEVVDEAIPSTCTQTGLTEGKHCSVCNEVLVAQKVTELAKHSMVAIEYPAKCGVEGFTYHYCTVCEGKDVEFIDSYKEALVHKFTIFVEEQMVSCLVDGFKTMQCENDGCTETETTVTPAVGYHVVTVDGKDIHFVDECVEGVTITKYECKVCNTDYTNDIKHDYEESFDSEDCTKYVYTVKVCYRCGDYTTDITKNENHEFGAWYEYKAPTLSENGEDRRDCKYCDVYESETTSAEAGVQFDFEMENLKGYAQETYSGRFKVVIKTTTKSANFKVMVFELGFDASVVNFVKGELVAKDKDGQLIFAQDELTFTDSKKANENGSVVITVNATGGGDATLGNGDFAVLYFDVVADKAGEKIDFTAEKGLVDIDNADLEVIVGETPVSTTNIVGKLTSDGNKIGAADAAELLNIINATSDEAYRAEADFNKDGVINAIDYALLKQYLVKNSDQLGE